MFRWLWWLHVRLVLFPLPGLPERWGVGQERISLLPSGLLHALHTGTAPQTGGQGEMGHWGLYWWRRGERLLLYPLCQLPDFLGDQGEGGKIDPDEWTTSVSNIIIKTGSWRNNVNIYHPHNFAQHLLFCVKHLQLNVWGGVKTPIMGQMLSTRNEFFFNLRNCGNETYIICSSPYFIFILLFNLNLGLLIFIRNQESKYFFLSPKQWNPIMRQINEKR